MDSIADAVALVTWGLTEKTVRNNVSNIDVCRNLRQHTRTTGIPVLMLSARTRDTDIQLGHAAGAHDHMIKPFNPQDLLHRVEDLIRDTTQR
jgi:DNA-binding response OmpR family regulator